MCISQMHAAKTQDLGRIDPDKPPGTEVAKFIWECSAIFFFCDVCFSSLRHDPASTMWGLPNRYMGYGYLFPKPPQA